MFLLILPAVWGLGAGLIWLAYRLRHGVDRFTVGARRATATVVGLHWRGHPADAFPVVRFQLPDGTPVEAQSTWGSRPARVREGERVEILYDPRDPTRIRLPGEKEAGAFLMVALIVAGIGFIGLGVLLVLVAIALSQLD